MLFRDEVLQEVKNILMGPNPLLGYEQENGEEILYYDSPLNTYVTGILFPKLKVTSELEEEKTEIMESDNYDYEQEVPAPIVTTKGEKIYSSNIAEPALDEETSKMNNYKQSAMGITVCIPNKADSICVHASVGNYVEEHRLYPKEKKIIEEW